MAFLPFSSFVTIQSSCRKGAAHPGLFKAKASIFLGCSTFEPFGATTPELTETAMSNSLVTANVSRDSTFTRLDNIPLSLEGLMIDFACPSCSQKYSVADHLLGTAMSF